MKIVVAGGTGFLGSPLCEAFLAGGHEVIVLTRSAPRSAAADRPSAGPGIIRIQWNPDGSAGPWARAVEVADIVINLAGEPIAARRWSARQKERIRGSRVLATRSLVSAIQSAARPPALLVSASGINYYPSTSQEHVTEDTPPGSDFLAHVVIAWEEEARRAASPRTRVVLVRTGIALERDGGALAKMIPPFKFFVGGPLGSGRQCMSWIHRDDWIRMVQWAVENESVAGPINVTAPQPVTNAEFSAALGRALQRPSWLPAPAFALRLLLGEMADPLLLTGACVVPARASALGFQFRYPTLDGALQAIFSRAA